MSNASTRPPRRDPLASFFRDQEESGRIERLNAHVIDRTRLDPNPYQPRHQTDPAALEELAASIRRVGILQPIVIRRVGERYQIIAGERRWRAAALADLSEIPCVERQLTDADMEMLALVENIQREDLHPLDEAHAYRRLMERFTLSLREIAGYIHKSHEHVAQRLRLIEFPEIEAAVRNGQLKITVAHEIAQIDDPVSRHEMLNQALAGTRLRVKDVRGSRPATKLERVAEDADRPPTTRPDRGDGLSATSDSVGPTEVSNNLTPAESPEGIRPVIPPHVVESPSGRRETSTAGGSATLSNNLTASPDAVEVRPSELGPPDPDISSDPLVDLILALRRRLDALPTSANSGGQSRLIGELEKLRESVQSLIGRLCA